MTARRVLIVVPGLAGNGISRFLVDLAKELPAFGVRAEIFTLEPLVLGDIPHEADAGADTRFAPTSGGPPPAAGPRGAGPTAPSPPRWRCAWRVPRAARTQSSGASRSGRRSSPRSSP